MIVELLIITICYLACSIAMVVIGVRYFTSQLNTQVDKLNEVYSTALGQIADNSQRGLEQMSGLIQELADKLLIKSGVDPRPTDPVDQAQFAVPADGFAAMRARGLDPLNPLHVEQWEEQMGGES